MIRASTIKDLLTKKITADLSPKLTPYSFKYVKAKKSFVRTKEQFKQSIYITTPFNPIRYDADEEIIRLHVDVSAVIQIPDFEKWGKQKELTLRFRHVVIQKHLYFTIAPEDFQDSDFYTPTKSQLFKNKMTSSLAGPDKERVSAESYLERDFLELVQRLDFFSDVDTLFKNRPTPLSYQHIDLLAFAGPKDLAEEYYQKFYDFHVEEVEKNKAHPSKFMDYVNRLDGFIAKAKKIIDLDFSNPYKKEMVPKALKQTTIPILEDTIFEEVLRLDTSTTMIHSRLMNSKGELVIYSDDQILLFNDKGVLICQKKIPANYRRQASLGYHTKSGVFPYTDVFFINNHIIQADHSFVELPFQLNAATLKKGKFNPNIRDFVFSKEKDRYYLLCQKDKKTTVLWSYHLDGSFDTEFEFSGIAKKIILEKNWVVTSDTDKKNYIWNFDGDLVAEHPFGNGNNGLAVSPSLQYFICHSYSTKSQFYDLVNKKKKPLWAHPTFISGYKETFYNDINHNFGLNKIIFAPDESYIIGGADHGKYVAWELPSLKRIELIPDPSILDKFSKIWKVYQNGQELEKTFTPSIETLNGERFLKNRGNSLGEVFFINNGDYFVTQIKQSLLVWNRQFENIDFIENIGYLKMHQPDYLTVKEKAELIVYRKQ